MDLEPEIWLNFQAVMKIYSLKLRRAVVNYIS